jgi:predicted regulator of amino acid metabolism with ACT domain
MEKVLQKVKEASRIVATLQGSVKRKVLNEMADMLEKNQNEIIEANKKDLEYAKNANLSSALIDRLLLNENRIKSMAEALRDIAKLKDPVGRVIDGWVLDNGLRIEKVKIPIGVIGIIYESRPNVTSDAAGLCFMSGNACILKGGKEAMHSNITIIEILQYVLEKNHLHKYVTDFPTKNLLKRINNSKDVMIFPHLGASTKESEINCAVMACSQLSDFLKSGKIVNSVNFPNINSEKFGTHRLFIANNNEPGIISKIAECLATNKINISEFVNKSRGDLACNIIDTDDEIPIDVVSKLEKINGVSKARLCY